MRIRTKLLAGALLALAVATLPAQQPMPPGQLVREVVYNELHDHARHGYWRYWITDRTAQKTRAGEQVETAEGPVTRYYLCDGHPLDAAGSRAEQQRLDQLLNSPDQQARLRQQYAADEQRIGRIVALLPDAFLYQYGGRQDGSVRLLFHPNPAYPVRTIEARIFHAMSGELWVSLRDKRLVRLEGHLDENVDFGYGILGRLDKGGWFRLQRAQVSATDWKTDSLEIHMQGRALLFKTIARETSQTRVGFQPLPSGLRLAQGVALLRAEPAPGDSGPGPIAPASLPSKHEQRPIERRTAAQPLHLSQNRTLFQCQKSAKLQRASVDIGGIARP